MIVKGVASFRDGRNHVRNRASFVFLVAGTIWTALHGFGLLGPLETSTFHVFSVATFLATLLGIYWYRPAARWPWIAIAAGLMLFVARRHRPHRVADLRQPHRDPHARPRPHHPAGIRPVRDRARGPRPASPARAGRQLRRAPRLRDRGPGRARPRLGVPDHSDACANDQTPVTVRLLLSCYPPMSVFLVAITARIAFSPATRRAPCVSLPAARAGLPCWSATPSSCCSRPAAITMPIALIDLPYAIAYVALRRGSPAPFDARAVGAGERRSGRTHPGSPGLRGHRARRSPRSSPSRSPTSRPPTASCSPRSSPASPASRSGGCSGPSVSTPRSEAILAHQATHDDLTGLPNRLAAREHVSTGAEQRGASSARSWSLVFLDVDRFKLVNDTVGHSLGDELLVAVAAAPPGDGAPPTTSWRAPAATSS